MEDYSKISQKFKLTQMFIDDNNKIPFSYLYAFLIPKFNSDQYSNDKLEMEFNEDMYTIKIIKRNYVYFDIHLFENRQKIKIIEKVLLNQYNYITNSKKVKLLILHNLVKFLIYFKWIKKFYIALDIIYFLNLI